ncbi:uncharacterized protein BXZ73DRAFT_99502 [Epithele typhae]|uniref:uncharacterized protein n=1 Tax=Epithele typhae TaxID=378194 RepID=UPI002008E672|nr:uncharacterized protein BXZ73DRAFT_99502 [Epithele typhae]KAH9939300.1 hypothetical protein BXZ73DRAFT_99502 [Epithele typhae]
MLSEVKVEEQEQEGSTNAAHKAVKRLAEENADLRSQLDEAAILSLSQLDEVANLRSQLEEAAAQAVLDSFRIHDLEDSCTVAENLRSKFMQATNKLAEFQTKEYAMTSERSAEELRETLWKLPSPNGPNPGDKTTQPIFDCVEAFEMSELAIQACAADGYCFFPSLFFARHHDRDSAYVLYPKYKFEVGQEIPDHARWAIHEAAVQFDAQEQRDVLYGRLRGDVCYAGTFYADIGSVCLPYAQASVICQETDILTILARETLNMSPPYEQSDKDHYIKIVKDLYLSGYLPVRFLGLQRVWFNTKLFGILDTEYKDHLSRKAQEQTASARPARRKRKSAPENVESGRPSGSKAPRVGHGAGDPRPVGAD